MAKATKKDKEVTLETVLWCWQYGEEQGCRDWADIFEICRR